MSLMHRLRRTWRRLHAALTEPIPGVDNGCSAYARDYPVRHRR